MMIVLKEVWHEKIKKVYYTKMETMNINNNDNDNNDNNNNNE